MVYDIDPDSLPIDSSTACQSSVSLPRPSGKVWRLLLNSVQNKEDRVIEDKLVKAVTDMAMRAAIETERLERGMTKHDRSRARQAKVKVKKKRNKTISSGEEQPPMNLRQAFEHQIRNFDWVDAANKELDD